MLHRYFPHTPDDIKAMLARCGMTSLDELYADIPESLRLKGDYDIPAQMSEDEVRARFMEMGEMNAPLVCFAGSGYYDHYAPAVISHIISRSEYLTAYTPYQPEISQGTLQYIFEYQSMMTDLTGLDVSNASMYDGATALAEAMMMAVAHARKRSRVLVSGTVSSAYLAVMNTYARYHGVRLDIIPEVGGVTDLSAMDGMLAEGDVAGVVLPLSNHNGIIEDYTGVADRIHAAKALMIMTAPASMLGVLRSPGEWGADVAAGDAQSLGMPMNYGGPGLGYMCCTKALIRKLPGRIVGQTTDARGRRVFVLTLQAREQHIRREKATSNICSNQGIMTLYASVYLSLMGPEGLREVNAISAARTRALVKSLEDTGLFRLTHPDKPYLCEALLDYTGDSSIVSLQDLYNDVVLDYGILPGILRGKSQVVVCATERRTPAEIDEFAEAVRNVYQNHKSDSLK